MNTEREKIKLNTAQLREVVFESYYEKDGEVQEFDEITREITGTSRHGKLQ